MTTLNEIKSLVETSGSCNLPIEVTIPTSDLSALEAEGYKVTPTYKGGLIISGVPTLARAVDPSGLVVLY